MHNLFNPDNPATRFLSRLWDLILLNVCFILTSIPIFTIGASLAALYHTVLLLPEDEPEWSYQPYFKAFKQNFKQATKLWLVLLPIGIFLASDLYIIYFVIDETYRWMQYPIWAMMIVWACIVLYVFPLLGRYEESTTVALQNAIRLAIGNLPTTIFFVVILFGLGDLAWHNGTFLVVLFSIWLFIGNAAIASFFSVFLRRIFEKAEAAA